MSLRALIAASLLCAALPACAAVAVTAAPFQAKSAGTALDDSTAASEIKGKLLSKRGYGDVSINVSSGLVLLSGHVKTIDKRIEAERVAWTSSRAHNVVNEIEVGEPGGFKKSFGDEVISARVRRRLTTSLKVRGVNFNVETHNGTVYLLGIARSQAEHEKAAEKASFVRGVKKVVSYVTVRQPERALTADAHPPYQGAARTAYRPIETPDEDLLGGEW